MNGRTVRIDGRAIHYVETGAGDPLVLIHGGGPGASGISNYRRNLEALGAHYRLIVPDLPGFGRSGKEPVEGPRYAAYASAVAGLLDAIGIAKAHVVGNSLGGGTAIKLALEAPDRVGKLVLMGPAGLASAYGRVPTEGARMIFEYYRGDGPSRAKLEAFLRFMVHDPSGLTPALVEERYQASVDPEVIASPPFGLGAPPLLEELWRDPRLAALPHETLLLWGREDRVNPASTAEILIDQLPNAQFVSFTRCGHWVQWEKAVEFNAIVAAFLAGYRA